MHDAIDGHEGERGKENAVKLDPIRGHCIVFTFADGPMAKRSIEHTFDDRGRVSFTMNGKSISARKCEIARVGDDVHAISYLSDSGTTLTVILDFDTGRLIAFSSNESELGLQQGTFEVRGSYEANVSTRNTTSAERERFAAKH